MRGGLGIEAGEFRPEGGQQRFAVLALARGLRLVPADEIAPPALAGSHHNLLDLELLGHRPKPPGPDQDLRLDLRELAHGHRQEVVAQTLGQLPAIGLRVHPGVAHEEGPAELPPPEVVLDLRDRGDVERGAGPGLRGVIRVVDREVHTRGVPEDEVDVRPEEIGGPEEDLPLDGRVVGVEEIQGAYR